MTYFFFQYLNIFYLSPFDLIMTLAKRRNVVNIFLICFYEIFYRNFLSLNVFKNRLFFESIINSIKMGLLASVLNSHCMSFSDFQFLSFALKKDTSVQFPNEITEGRERVKSTMLQIPSSSDNEITVFCASTYPEGLQMIASRFDNKKWL